MINGYVKGNRVVLVSRDATGKLKTGSVPAEYVTYFKAEDLDRVEGLRRSVERASSVRGIKVEGDWLRVSWRDEWTRRAFLNDEGSDGTPNLFKRHGITIYEGDVSPVRRYCVDHAVQITNPKRAYFDLETDSRVGFSEKEKMRILSFAIVGDDGREHAMVLEEDTDEAEKTLLESFWAFVYDYDQLIAWNGDGFDFPVLLARTTDRKIKVDTQRFLLLDQLLVYKRLNVASESGDEKTSLKLQDVAMQLLGHGKDDFDASKTYQEWATGDRDRLLKYNIQDTRLLKEIEEKTGFISLFQVIAEACRVFPDTQGLNPTQQVDSFLLRLGLEHGVHFRSRTRVSGEIEPYQGAFVLEPKYHGIARNIHVADFASLYPSIILTWNMSPETKLVDSPTGQLPPGRCRSPKTGICFDVTTPGLLPTALRVLLDLRKSWNFKKAALPPGTDDWKDADRKSTAYKVVANSFYGVIGTPYSRYFDRDIAESVALNGRWLIEHTISSAEDRGWTVGYADTDSLFVGDCSEEAFSEFVSWTNRELYPEILAKIGCKENAIKLAYEKAFERIVFTSAKRYAGNYLHYKGTRATEQSKPEIKGLEYKRGDTALLARQLQESVINKLLHGNELASDYVALVEAFQTKILKEPLTLKEVVISKSLSKSLKDYGGKVKKDGSDASVPAHVTVAKVLKDRGEEIREGSRISYVVIDGSVSPMGVIPAVDYQSGEVDRHYLWEHLVYPPTQRFLEHAFPDHVEEFQRLADTRPKKSRKASDKKTLTLF